MTLTPISKSSTESPLGDDVVVESDAAWIDYGYVLKAHGVFGDLRVVSHADIPLPPSIEEMRLVPRRGPPRVVTLSRLRPVHGAYLVTFEEVSGREVARALKGATVQLHRSVLPALEGDEYYLFELKGARVVNEEGALLGEVSEILDNSGQVLLKLDYEGAERLLPLVDAWGRGYTRDSHQLMVAVPQGLWEE